MHRPMTMRAGRERTPDEEIAAAVRRSRTWLGGERVARYLDASLSTAWEGSRRETVLSAWRALRCNVCEPDSRGRQR